MVWARIIAYGRQTCMPGAADRAHAKKIRLGATPDYRRDCETDCSN
jgi:hypothetical protein